MANTYLTRTPSSSGNRKTWTFSVWFKKNKQSSSAQQKIFSAQQDANNKFECYFTTDDKLSFYHYSSNGSVTDSFLGTNQVFRDTNAWYHLVLEVDTTQATASNRVKMYVNGEQVTSFSSASYFNQNYDTYINWTYEHRIGANLNSSQYFDGSMSHIHLIDGTAYDATAFGQYDANGVWTIKTSPSVTYGTNGFFILKDGNSVTDQSPNTNNFTVGGGNLTKTEDNPSNVFATWNPLDSVTSLGDSTFTYGNNKFNSESGSNKCWARSTLGMTSGKYYFEMKIQTPSNNCAIGISDRPAPNLTDELGAGAYDYCYQSSNGETINNTTQSSGYGNSYTTNDIVMCALDLDNNKLYFGKNGTWQNSGDPTSGATGTGAAYSVTAPSSTNGGAYFFCGADLTGANNVRLLANFGNGIFADNDPVASAGTNASGNGIFEYDVPTGYTALSTKGLNL